MKDITSAWFNFKLKLLRVMALMIRMKVTHDCCNVQKLKLASYIYVHTTENTVTL